MKKKKDELMQEELAQEKAKSNDREQIPEDAESAPKKEEAKDFGAQNSQGDADRARMQEDISLFHSLFPEVKAQDIPEEVWARVENGESLAASFALFTVQKAKEEEHIRAVNEENEKKAPPRIRHDGKETEYFSPEAVKAMSRSEIKKNYDAILASMDKWN